MEISYYGADELDACTGRADEDCSATEDVEGGREPDTLGSTRTYSE